MIATVAAAGSAAILPKQPVSSLSTAHLFTKGLQARTAIMELSSTALYFPAQIEQFGRSIPLAKAFANQRRPFL
ncbi:MAG: hypothetical protein ABL905_04100 [Nitrospiraceae bacterium]